MSAEMNTLKGRAWAARGEAGAAPAGAGRGRGRRPLMRPVPPAAVLALLVPLPAAAQQPPATDARIHQIVGAVSAERLRADLTRLVGFGTRHTLSDTLSPTRG